MTSTSACWPAVIARSKPAGTTTTTLASPRLKMSSTVADPRRLAADLEEPAR
jgi:hypothetical protein